jgi:hypothetical protein
MKSNWKMILVGCIFASLFFACSGEQQEVKIECEEPAVSSINPNGDSELALLMRKMFLDADSIKQLITTQEGVIADEFIAELEKVHTATPTDADVKTPEFKAYNDLLINEAKALKDADNKIEGFNNLVKRCIDCHKVYCPGPIVRINKLNIVNPVK